MDFSLCNVNCAVSDLHEDESTDGWGCGVRGWVGLQKRKKSWGIENRKNPSNELTKVLLARSRLLVKIISIDVPKNSGSSLFLT